MSPFSPVPRSHTHSWRRWKRYQALALACPDRNVPAFQPSYGAFASDDGIVESSWSRTDCALIRNSPISPSARRHHVVRVPGSRFSSSIAACTALPIILYEQPSSVYQDSLWSLIFNARAVRYNRLRACADGVVHWLDILTRPA